MEIFKSKKISIHNKTGFSFIEIIVIIAVIGILVSAVVPQFSKIRQRQVLKSAAADILSSLDKARTETLSSLNSSEYGVYFEADKVTIFKGTTFTANSPDNEVVLLTDPANISNVTFGGVSSSSGSLYFNRLSAAPNTYGTVTVNTPSYTKTITISATGMSSIN